MARLPMPFPNPATYKGHSGVDYPQKEGTPFRASAPGVVVSRGRNTRGGFYIWVRYDGIDPAIGYHHLPSHEQTLAPGTRFNYYDVLGLVGNTGNSTGPHLHSEVSGYGTTDGYWKFFDTNKTVGNNEKGEDDMLVNIQGRAGVRSGGSFFLRNGVATFLGATVQGAPSLGFDEGTKLLALHKVTW